MDRPHRSPLTARLGTALLLTAAALTALPAATGAWSTAPSSTGQKAKIVTSGKTTSTKAAPAAKTKAAARRSSGRPSLAATTIDRRPLAMGISLIEGSTWTREDDLPALDAFASRSGRMPASFSVWSDWGNKTSVFPPRWLLQGLRERGVRPILFWAPTGPDARTNPDKYSYTTIANGAWDDYLVSWSRDAAAWGDRIIVRFAHEMNAPWFPWAIGRNGNSPEAYKAAWRHIVTKVRAIAPNVRFMWSPNQPCGECIDYATIFPGDDYVNVLGFSSYNWTGDANKTMVSMYRKVIPALMAVSKRRIVAAETGIKTPGTQRGRWLREGYTGIYQAFPRLKGVMYFDVDMTFGNEPVWKLVSSDDSLDSYSQLQRDPRFAGRM